MGWRKEKQGRTLEDKDGEVKKEPWGDGGIKGAEGSD